VVIDNTRIEHMNNTETPGNGTNAVRLSNAIAGSLRNSVVSFAGDGVNVSNSNAAATLRFHVYGTQLTRLFNGALQTSGAPGASLHINLENSLINQTFAALLHGHGQAIFTWNVIANNANSFVDCSGGGATFSSFGYGNNIGSNSVYNNSDNVLPPGCSAWVAPTQFTGK